ncbi:MAG: T9SS type A sorting domain-containing protein [Flavobacteriales bacterium]|nr:T9SS type A sorting domain-containing protein [Flavobacteriales bacterium]
MKKIYLMMLSLTIVSVSAFSQSKMGVENLAPVSKYSIAPRIDHQELQTLQSRSSDVVWSSDFSTPGDWDITNEAGNADNWVIGTNGPAGTFAIDDIVSTSGGNFALFDSDNMCSGNQVGNLTTANPINLSTVGFVVLQFEQYYRRFNDSTFVFVSTDGTTWVKYTVNQAFSNGNTSTTNSELISVNITATAANQAQVWIRFQFSSPSSYPASPGCGYSWQIDDVAVLEGAPNDLAATTAYITHDGTGNEYGRIPQSQLLPTFFVGGAFDNLGSAVQNNVTAVMTIDGPSTSFGGSTNIAQALVGATNFMDEIATPTQTPLEVGVYEGAFTVVSNEEGIGAPTFGNNTYLRNFEVTANAYTLDGLGNHPVGYQALNAIGTASFADNEDGLMVLGYYSFTQTANIIGVQILLANGTEAGSSLIVSVHDTADVLTNGDMYNALAQSTLITITQANVDDGFVVVPITFTTGIDAFYVGAELFSDGNANDVAILDDETVPQPFLTSIIYLPFQDQIFTNGTAITIRLITDDVVIVGVEEEVQLSGISIYPNPTEGVIRIDVEQQDTYTIEVMNVIGKQVYSSTVSASTFVDLKQFGAGIYVVRVSSEKETFTQKVIVQ